MVSIIVAFPNIENAKGIRRILQKNEFEVHSVCNSASSVISYANQLDEGIIICGYNFSDMHYYELREYIPETFDMILVTSAAKLDNGIPDNINVLTTPIKTSSLLSLVNEVEKRHIKKYNRKGKNKNRSAASMKEIAKAKQLLMEHKGLDEEEAHRYLQKTSMNNSTSLEETAGMIITLYS